MTVLKRRETRCQKITFILCFTKRHKRKSVMPLFSFCCEGKWNSGDIVFPSHFSMMESILLTRKGRIIFDDGKRGDASTAKPKWFEWLSLKCLSLAKQEGKKWANFVKKKSFNFRKSPLSGISFVSVAGFVCSPCVLLLVKLRQWRTHFSGHAFT